MAIPKRTVQRRRRNKTTESGIPNAVDTVHVEGKVWVPDPDPAWHPLAKQWFESLKNSGQSRYYEPSDWATAFVVAENLSRELKPHFLAMSEKTGKPVIMEVPMTGTAMTSFLRASAVLLTTEGDRRRLRMEIERSNAKIEKKIDDPAVVAMADWKSRAAGG